MWLHCFGLHNMIFPLERHGYLILPHQAIFIDKRGIEVLLDMLMDPNVTHRSHREAAAALLQLTKKLDAHLPGEAKGRDFSIRNKKD